MSLKRADQRRCGSRKQWRSEWRSDPDPASDRCLYLPTTAPRHTAGGALKFAGTVGARLDAHSTSEQAHALGGRSAGSTLQAGQLWALRGRIRAGDLLAMPLKTTRRIALGRVIAPYQYRADEPDLERRHVVSVDWQRTDLPRSAVKQDLLFTLGSAMSIFSPSKNNAVERLEALLVTGTDPGHAVSLGPQIGPQIGAASVPARPRLRSRQPGCRAGLLLPALQRRPRWPG